MASSVFCIASSYTMASDIITRLKGVGFSENDISALYPDRSGTRDFAHEASSKAPEGATAGAGAGGLVGGVLGLLAGVGLLTIPGVGPLLAAGPIMAALSGAAVGAAVGGLTGALVGMGIPEIEAKRYEGKIRSGNILLSVHAENAEEVDRARRVYEQAGAEDIATSSESSAPKPKASTETKPTRPVTSGF